MVGRLAVVAVLTLWMVGLASCGDDDSDADGTFDVEGFPLTFSYPDDFQELEDVTFEEQIGGAAEQSAAIGLDEQNGIFLQRATLTTAIDDSNINLAQREIEGLLGGVDSEASSEVTEIAGLPALTVDGVPVPTVEDGVSRLNFVFDGDQEYVINCQSSPDRRDEVESACDQVLETLAFE